jgi:hypothetical protein
MKKLSLIMLAIVLSSTMVIGCAKKDNPAAPVVDTHSVHFVVEAVPVTPGAVSLTPANDVLSHAVSIVYNTPDTHAEPVTEGQTVPLPWTSPSYNMIEGTAATITINCACYDGSNAAAIDNTFIKATIYKDGVIVNTSSTQLNYLMPPIVSLSSNI